MQERYFLERKSLLKILTSQLDSLKCMPFLSIRGNYYFLLNFPQFSHKHNQQTIRTETMCVLPNSKSLSLLSLFSPRVVPKLFHRHGSPFPPLQHSTTQQSLSLCLGNNRVLSSIFTLPLEFRSVLVSIIAAVRWSSLRWGILDSGTRV